MAKYYYTNMISALATGQISYRDAMCEILKRLCDLENDKVQNQADWTETDSTSPSYIQHKPSVQEFQADWNETNSTAYGYIQNKPEIQEQVQADWTETNSNSKAYIKNKPGTTAVNNPQPSLVPPTANTDANKVLHPNGHWSDVDSFIIDWTNGIMPSQQQNFNNLVQADQAQADWQETDQSSPSYIRNKPSLPSAQVQSDWAETDTSDVSFIKNKPGTTTSGATLGTLVPPTANTDANKVLHPNGHWSDVDSFIIDWTNGIMPSQQQNFNNLVQADQAQADWQETDQSSPSYIRNKPSLPSAQVQSDWAETDTSDVSFIKNKPGTTTSGATLGTLVPPTANTDANKVLHPNGHWSDVDSFIIDWTNGINSAQVTNFRNQLILYGLYPRVANSRYTQCFAYMEPLPNGANNLWGCQVIQEWIPGKWWHFNVWCIKSIANNSSITTPFFNYGINLDYIVEHTDLTPEQYAIASNEGRIYSQAQKIDGYQIDGDTDLFGRYNLTDTEIGGIALASYNAGSTTGYTGGIRFCGYKYSGDTMTLTDYPLAQQKIGAFKFDIWVMPAI